METAALLKGRYILFHLAEFLDISYEEVFSND